MRFSYLAVTPFLDIALRQQAATSDENLDTFGDSIVSIVTFRQFAAHFVRSFENHKCDFPPRCFSNGKNDFINLEVAQRAHCQRFRNALMLRGLCSNRRMGFSKLGHYRPELSKLNFKFPVARELAWSMRPDGPWPGLLPRRVRLFADSQADRRARIESPRDRRVRARPNL